MTLLKTQTVSLGNEGYLKTLETLTKVHEVNKNLLIINIRLVL